MVNVLFVFRSREGMGGFFGVEFKLFPLSFSDTNLFVFYVVTSMSNFRFLQCNQIMKQLFTTFLKFIISGAFVRLQNKGKLLFDTRGVDDAFRYETVIKRIDFY